MNTMKLTLLLIPLILLSSCSIDWNGEKDKKIAELEKQIQDDTFKKKQECSSYFHKIEEDEKEYVLTEKDFSSIESVFYSKKHNTCLYAVHRYNVGDWSNWFLIFNYLSKELMYTSWLINVSSNQEDYNYAQLSWKNKTKELKWE